MRTDQELKQMVMEEFELDPLVPTKHVSVSVEDGVVTISGQVTSYVAKVAAELSVARVLGIRGVVDSVTTEIPHLNQRADSEIAKAAAHILEWDVMVPQEHVNVRVEDGCITLSGVVKYGHQKAAAESAVRNMIGLKAINNEILVEHHAERDGVKKVIIRQMQKAAERDIDAIKVEVHDGTATLRGVVRTLAEREEAERAARSVPGVAVVNNYLALSY
jgi:osmotically-inducible protein OsmY